MPKRNVMEEDFGFEIPTETIPLPTRGIVYNVESSLHNREVVDIKAMTAKEEDILTSRALIKKGTVISELISSCLIDKNIEVEDMLLGDRNAVMTALRITGYGSEYSLNIECPECNKKSRQDFDLSKLPIKRLAIEPVAAGCNVFEFDLPVTKQTARFKFLTGKDEKEISVVQERQKKQGQTSDNFVTTRLKYALIAVGKVKDKSKIQMFISHMPARDSLALRKYMDKHEPGIEMKAWMQCPHCQESSEVRLPVGANFFWPDAQ